LQSTTSAPFIVIEPLWVWAVNLEPGDKGADSWTCLSYFARMAQLPILILQPAKIISKHRKQPSDTLVKWWFFIFGSFKIELTFADYFILIVPLWVLI
jgi:hypothetical protein